MLLKRASVGSEHAPDDLTAVAALRQHGLAGVHIEGPRRVEPGKLLTDSKTAGRNPAEPAPAPGRNLEHLSP